MRSTTLIRKSVMTAGLIAAFAALPMVAATAAETGAQAMTSDNQTVPDKAADTWITTKVKSEFATDSHVKGSDISVTTADGVVNLSGTVPTAKEKTHAQNVAKKVKGVKSVDASGLTVSAAASN
ncbi:MAG: BON domain-containing protein [Dyella sp.]